MSHDTWHVAREILLSINMGASSISLSHTAVLLCFTPHQSIDNTVNQVKWGFNRNNRFLLRGCALLLFAWGVPGGQFVLDGVVPAHVSCALSHLNM